MVKKARLTSQKGIYVVARDRQEAKVAKAGPPEMQQPRSDNAAIV